MEPEEHWKGGSHALVIPVDRNSDMLIERSGIANQMFKSGFNRFVPNIVFDYNIFKKPRDSIEKLEKIFTLDNIENYFFYNQKDSKVLNSSMVGINNFEDNTIILDKILINLPLIATECNQNYNLFLELYLLERLLL